MSKLHSIMLRFRPIAPKPVARDASSVGSSADGRDVFSGCGGAKRKYVKNNDNNKRGNQRTRRRKTIHSPEQKDPVPAATLSLLPEAPDPKDAVTEKNRNPPVWRSFENRRPATSSNAEAEPLWCGGASDPAGLGGCSVTVECVMETWDEGEGLGSTDEERKVKLSEDTCPGFISDGYGRVTWTNRAYREMMGHGGGVWLAMKVRVSIPERSFTCRVRVQCYGACGKEKSSVMVPCDVWRMDSGGFAWRLDVKAALSLSLGW